MKNLIKTNQKELIFTLMSVEHDELLKTIRKRYTLHVSLDKINESDRECAEIIDIYFKEKRNIYDKIELEAAKSEMINEIEFEHDMFKVEAKTYTTIDNSQGDHNVPETSDCKIEILSLTISEIL